MAGGTLLASCSSPSTFETPPEAAAIRSHEAASSLPVQSLRRAPRDYPFGRPDLCPGAPGCLPGESRPLPGTRTQAQHPAPATCRTAPAWGSHTRIPSSLAGPHHRLLQLTRATTSPSEACRPSANRFGSVRCAAPRPTGPASRRAPASASPVTKARFSRSTTTAARSSGAIPSISTSPTNSRWRTGGCATSMSRSCVGGRDRAALKILRSRAGVPHIDAMIRDLERGTSKQGGGDGRR